MTDRSTHRRRVRAVVSSGIVTAFYLFCVLVVAPLAAGTSAQDRTFPAGLFALPLFALSYLMFLKLPGIFGRTKEK